MTLRYLYELGLESPGHWFMFFGAASDSRPNEPPRLDVEMFYAFTLGLVKGEGARGETDAEYAAFLMWLRDTKGEFSGGGWAAKFLADAAGDHVAAIGRFQKRLTEFVLETRPPWLSQLSAQPLASKVKNGRGEPVRQDIRNPEHVAALFPEGR